VLPIKRLAPLALGGALLLSACASGATDTSSSAPSTDTSTPSDPAAALDALGFTQLSESLNSAKPAPATLKDGSTFTLKQSIADKIAKGEPINYVISYGSKSLPLFSAQYLTGYEATLPIANSILPMTGKDVSPSTPAQDTSAQLVGIEALLNTGQIDCLSIQPLDDVGMTDITNKAMAEGIPVFTVGVTSNANEFTNFTQISYNEGKQAAQIVADWMKETGTDLKVFAVSGGDPSASTWAQGRMKGFIDGITELVPGSSFVNGPSDAIATTYDPAATYDAYKAFLTGNPDVQFIENVDIGAEHANRAIKDAGRVGKVFTIGWNLSDGQFDGIEAGIQVAALDQAWPQQAGFGALACATFLKSQLVMPNTQKLIPVTKANVKEARAEFNKIS
jgi:ribose transport system substrate-binding protein